MKMEILLEPTSNKLIVEHAEYDESNTYVLERFNTTAGNPVKKILLKLNLSDHRLFKDGGGDADVLRMDRLIGGSADGSSTSGSADGSLVGDASITWSVAVLLSSGLWQLFTSFHALFYRRLGKWHTRGVIQVSVLTLVLDLGPSVSVFRAFYTRMYSDGLFSFSKRSLSAPSCLSKPPDSIKNWADHFFWVDSRVFPISVPLNTGGVLEKDPAPHLTTRQEQAVQILSSNKAPFRRYRECFLALVGLSPYYPFGENTYPAFERPDKMGG
ncbi:hypothetical protein Tco_1167034 [Tanacetum coccineum]